MWFRAHFHTWESSMGRNIVPRQRERKLGNRSRTNLLGPAGRNEWREFVKETSTAKFCAIGFCLLSAGITLVGFVTSLVLGSQKNLGLGNLLAATGGYSVYCKLRRWLTGRRSSPAK